METTNIEPRPDPSVLLEIIKTQTEIAKLGLDLGAVMMVAAKRAHQLTNSSGAVIELLENDEMVYRAASGIGEPQLGLRIPRQGSLSGQCISAAKTLICDDSEIDERVNREACRKVGLRSMIVMPLNHAASVVGVLKVMSPQVAAFSAQDIGTLSLLTELIAAAMYHATSVETNDLYFRATHDPLTGLANRALFFDRLRHQLAQASRNSERVALLNLDMDHLKPINDQLGHRVGDAAIKEVGSRILGISRESDTVARVGGDEFGVILPKIDGNEKLQAYIGRIEDQLAASFAFEQHQLTLRVSVGTAIFPDDGTEMDALIDKADQLMYQAKRSRHAARSTLGDRS